MKPPRSLSLLALLFVCIICIVCPTSYAQTIGAVDSIYSQLEATYIDLHRNPELSAHETRTAAKLADDLRQLGYEVTTGVGGTGVVGVMKNGSGHCRSKSTPALPTPARCE